jgi:hypothetical protein
VNRSYGFGEQARKKNIAEGYEWEVAMGVVFVKCPTGPKRDQHS